MKTLGIEQASLEACVREAQGERVLVTRDGRPVAIVVGLAGLDEEQLQFGAQRQVLAVDYGAPEATHSDAGGAGTSGQRRR